MKKTKIGCLIPYSGIFPTLREDFLQGITLALDEAQVSGDVVLVPAFINMGDLVKVREVLQKLIMFERVDIVTGVVNLSVISRCAEELSQYQVPIIVNNLGERIPAEHMSHPWLFCNSLHLWKSQWSMGRWAQQQFGGLPSISMAFYEGGYSLHESFRLGATEGGASRVHIHMLQMQPPGVYDTTPLVRILEEELPGHAHVLLSGKEAGMFLEQFRASGLRDRIPVSISPLMTAGISLEDLSLVDQLYSATTWSADILTAANQLFVQRYEDAYQQQPPVYAMLGYETGVAIAAAWMKADRIKLKTSLQALLSNPITGGPRGMISIAGSAAQHPQPVYIRQVRIDNGIIKQAIVAEDSGIEWNDPSVAASAAQHLSGWQNPYLCV
ncbi:ABC transporter substrate-binding protein [Chitinophaga pendula]|uniref:ABC transporter substrate-binding protein n=1 Tax=Chitinophaga TaxID=79328 RepID=UPI000BAF3B5F|nr:MULTISPECIES: ABC transporter substrate-binding protein [Chitinophaga]ASZ10372.1 hypothetical protein CK934_04940 [Chitinophaga sp. MD30]UCJ06663.1 ABC transporter substrate-binding protein [Chitinophaga pendula]